jgi:hypothetical protein
MLSVNALTFLKPLLLCLHMRLLHYIIGVMHSQRTIFLEIGFLVTPLTWETPLEHILHDPLEYTILKVFGCVY